MLRKTALALTFAAIGVLPACMHDDHAALSPRPGGYGFFYVDEGPSAKLAYGEAQSDNVGLMLECAKGSRQVEITDAVRSAPAPVLTLISAGARTDFKADMQSADGPPIVVAHAPSAAPVLAGFRHSGRIEVAYAGLRYGVTAKPDERASVEQFFTACERRAA